MRTINRWKNGHLSVINGYQKIHDSVTHLDPVSAIEQKPDHAKISCVPKIYLKNEQIEDY